MRAGRPGHLLAGRDGARRQVFAIVPPIDKKRAVDIHPERAPGAQGHMIRPEAPIATAFYGPKDGLAVRHELPGDAHKSDQLTVYQAKNGGNGEQTGDNVFL